MNTKLFRSNLKVAWRNLLKYKLQTSISILSLTVGMVCFALSALWLRYENSYDAWWPEHDDVYMVQYYSATGYNIEHGYTNYIPLPMGQKIAESNHDIEMLTGILFFDGNLKLTPESEDSKGRFYMQIDEHAQEMFGIKVLEGRKKLVLAPDEVALTRTTAERLFNGKKAVGEKVWFPEMNYGMKRYLKVVAIVEDPQKPTSFPYDFITGINSFFINDGFAVASVFARIKPGNVDKVAKALEKAKATFHREEFANPEYVANDSWTREYSCKLIPLSQVRDNVGYVSKVIKRNHLQLFVLLGIIVICSAMFNYFTMLVTRIRIRQRELALRYVHGATMGNLIVLVATELVIILTISTLFATGIVSYVYEDFMAISTVNEPQSYVLGWFLVFALAAAWVSLALTAIIVYVCTRRQLRLALDKRQKPEGKKTLGGFRGGLMIIQLAVSIGAVFCSFVMMNQIHFLFSSPDMGFTKHNRGVINISTYENDDKYTDILVQKIKKWPEIEDFIVGYDYPIPNGFQNPVGIQMEDGEMLEFLWTDADEHYFRFMELQMVDGEFITSKDDPKMVCINETAARMLGEHGKVGAKVNDYYGQVVKGIVKDLSYMSPTTPAKPLIFFKHNSILDNIYWNKILVCWKEGTDWRKLKDKVDNGTKERLFGDDPNVPSIWMDCAEYEYDKFLQSEHTLVRLLMLVTAVCVLIAIFGIFSMVSLACERRRREIAIRKVHGAHTGTIIRMFLKEYIYLLLTSAVIAFPVGYYLMHLWLMQYVKQAPIHWWIYPSIILAMFALIYLTVIWQIRKAARENPADVMKSE